MHNQNKDYDFLMKFMLIGESCVGKAQILTRYSDDPLTPPFMLYQGGDFRIKLINRYGKKLKLQIWDTAGQERFREIITPYYRGSMGIMLVYDDANQKSFAAMEKWIPNICRQKDAGTSLVLVAHRFQEQAATVTQAQGRALAKRYNIPFVEVDARTGRGIDDAFAELIDDVMIRKMDLDQNVLIAQKYSEVMSPMKTFLRCQKPSQHPWLC